MQSVSSLPLQGVSVYQVFEALGLYLTSLLQKSQFAEPINSTVHGHLS